MKDELELALNFLKKRATPLKVGSPLNYMISIISISEVEEVLTMVQKGEFKAWYTKMKSEGGNQFP